MKLTKITAALLAVSASSASFAGSNAAEEYFGAGAGQDNGNITGTAPLGIATSEILRNALQEAQFGAGSPCIGNDGLICMPSIATSELNSILAGSTTGFDQMLYSGGTIFDILAANNGFKAAGNPIQITAATADDGNTAAAYAGGAGCQETFGWAGATAADTAAAIAALDGLVDSGKKGRAGLSVMAANVSVADSDVRFIKLDGVAPLLDEHLSGNYNLVLNAIDAGSALPAVSTLFGNVGGADWSFGSAVPAKNVSATGDACFRLRTGNGTQM